MLSRSCLTLITALWLAFAAPGRSAADSKISTPGTKDRCAVCGMFVAPFTSWVAAVRFLDGTVAYFDGPRDMFRYAFAVETFDASHTAAQIESLWVTEYYTSALMPAAELHFVLGSDVLGPMGRELVPIQGRESAQTFSVDHHGQKILAFKEITPAVLAEMP